LAQVVLKKCKEMLHYGLQGKGLKMERQLMMPIEYEALFIKDAYKVDLLVENKLVIEIKSEECILPVHFKQVNTY
jgi:GxxExxY protein